MIRPHRPTRRGFTLIELMAAMVVLAILGTTAASVMVRATTINTDTRTRTRIHTELATAMEQVDRALRTIPARVGLSTPWIDTVTASSISFGGTGQLSLSGSDLRLALPGEAAATILRDVSALSVRTYDATGTLMSASLSGSACDAIRRVEVTVTVTTGGLSDTLRTRVFLRCTVSGAGAGITP
jgi:prepilin-type N-terminal cleavage/methylation domain-containing protein